MKYRKVYVSPYCRGRPQGRGMGPVAHARARDAEIARNYHRGHTWYKGVDKDLIDTKSLHDSSLTRRENTRLMRDMFNFKNLR